MAVVRDKPRMAPLETVLADHWGKKALVIELFNPDPLIADWGTVTARVDPDLAPVV